MRWLIVICIMLVANMAQGKTLTKKEMAVAQRAAIKWFETKRPVTDTINHKTTVKMMKGTFRTDKRFAGMTKNDNDYPGFVIATGSVPINFRYRTPQVKQKSVWCTYSSAASCTDKAPAYVRQLTKGG